MKTNLSKNKVFVYGTLKDSSDKDNFYIRGNLYTLGPFPGVKLNGQRKVPGQIIEVTDDELEYLDRYEGVPDLYMRQETSVFSGDMFVCRAFVYEYNGPVDSNREIEKW